MVEHDTGSREVSNAEFKHAKQLYGADIVGGSLTTPVNRGFERFNPATPKKALDENSFPKLLLGFWLLTNDTKKFRTKSAEPNGHN